MRETSELLAVARGDQPADLVLRGGRLINVFTGQITPTDVAIHADRVAALGPGLAGREVRELRGAYVAPGLIDAHVHIESSLCTPDQLAAALLPRGVTTIVADPHEIANVAGKDGPRYIAAAARGLPLHVVMMAPSCVPASHLSTAGATLDAHDLAELRDEGLFHGLAEVMNFPGVVAGDPGLLEKIRHFAGRPVDGHCPELIDTGLNAYAAAGIGSDHECVTADEARAKLQRGLYLLIREASNARNLDALLPVITPENSRRICFCTDDRTPSELRDVGSIDEMLRRAIAFGIDPVTAWQIASLNPAEWFGLPRVGAIAPGRRADLVVFDDLTRPEPRLVWAGGQLVAEDGQLAAQWPTPPARPPGSRCLVDWDRLSLSVPVRKGQQARAIRTIPGQLLTRQETVSAPATPDGRLAADPAADLLKMLVAERHGASGRSSVGLIRGFGLREGAIAGTIAHDHHNLVALGVDDAAIEAAGRAVTEMGGGLAVCDGRGQLTRLPLPIAGLMSDRPFAEVAAGYDAVVAAARALGSPLDDPFMVMSFMALEVIPSLKLTDQGLVDGEAFALVELLIP